MTQSVGANSLPALLLEFQPIEQAAHCKRIECVVDLNHEGTVIGIEIMNLKLQTNPGIAESLGLQNEGPGFLTASLGSVKISFDEINDMFYARLAEHPLTEQAVFGLAITDRGGRLVALCVPSATPARPSSGAV